MGELISRWHISKKDADIDFQLALLVTEAKKVRIKLGTNFPQR